MWCGEAVCGDGVVVWCSLGQAVCGVPQLFCKLMPSVTLMPSSLSLSLSLSLV